MSLTPWPDGREDPPHRRDRPCGSQPWSRWPALRHLSMTNCHCLCHCLSYWVCHCLCLFVIFGHGRSVLRSDILHSREPTSDSKARPHLTGSWKTRPRKLVPFKSWERFWLSSHKIEKGPRSSDLPLVERLLVDGELWKPVEEVQQSRLACNQGLQDHHLREIPAGNRCCLADFRLNST